MFDGFYMFDGNTLLYAPNFVYNSAFELTRENRVSFTYPVQGWCWFDSYDDACDAYAINPDYYLPVVQETEASNG